jgi:hypothetical protein
VVRTTAVSQREAEAGLLSASSSSGIRATADVIAGITSGIVGVAIVGAAIQSSGVTGRRPL